MAWPTASPNPSIIINSIVLNWVNMYNAIIDNDYEKAKNIHYETLVFFKAIMAPNHPSLVKRAVALIGLPAGRTRAPLADPTDEQEKNLKEVIKSMKLKI